jgi:hypothetical protein
MEVLQELGYDVDCPRPPGAVKRPSRSLAFSYENPFCMGLLYGRTGRLSAQNGGFRPVFSLSDYASVLLFIWRFVWGVV